MAEKDYVTVAEAKAGVRAIELLRELIEHAAWYPSAIELTDMGRDGEELATEARAILSDAGVPLSDRNKVNGADQP